MALIWAPFMPDLFKFMAHTVRFGTVGNEGNGDGWVGLVEMKVLSEIFFFGGGGGVGENTNLNVERNFISILHKHPILHFIELSTDDGINITLT